jgi:hypothetical protein
MNKTTASSSTRVKVLTGLTDTTTSLAVTNTKYYLQMTGLYGWLVTLMSVELPTWFNNKFGWFFKNGNK